MANSKILTGTLAVVPARMGSRRLPGKVMLPLGDSTVLDQVIHRIQAAGIGAQIVVAIPEGAENRVLRTHCEARGIRWFAGSGTDLISRLLAAARYFEAGHLLCCSASDPLLHPKMLWASVRHAVDNDLDLVTVGRMPIGSCGIAMPVRTLRRIDETVQDPNQREQMLSYALTNTQFSTAILPPPARLARQDLSFTLESEADYWFLRRIFDEVPPRADGVIALEDAITHIDRNQDLWQQSANQYAVVRAA